MDHRAVVSAPPAKRRRAADDADAGASSGDAGNAHGDGAGPDLASRLLAALGGAASGDGPAPPPPSDRDRWRAAFPDWCTPAARAITIRVGDTAPWHPPFTHQCFEGEVVFGWRAPSLAITFDDPAMAAVSAVWEHDGRIDEAAVHMPAGLPPPQPDDPSRCLRNVLPDGVAVHIRRRPSTTPGAGGSGADDPGVPPGDVAPTIRLPHAALFVGPSAPDRTSAPAARGHLPGVRVSEYTRSVATTGAPVTSSTPAGAAASLALRRFVIHRWCIAGEDSAAVSADGGAGAGGGDAGTGDTVAAAVASSAPDAAAEACAWTRAYHDAMSTLAIWLIESEDGAVATRCRHGGRSTDAGRASTVD
jgi:hypothetical protein